MKRAIDFAATIGTVAWLFTVSMLVVDIVSAVAKP